MEDDADVCGHETANGTPCQNPATDDGSCWLDAHGGSAAPSGRPSKLSHSRQEEICQAVEAGKSLTSAARMAGVDRTTVYGWIDRGEAEKEAGNDNEFTEFYDRLKDVWYDEYDHAKHMSVIMDEYSGEDSWHWKGGQRDYRGPNWHIQRKKALERSNYCCESCGLSDKEHREQRDYGLHVHHIVPRRNFENDDPEQNALSNLTVLCHQCHEMYEGTNLSPVQRSTV